MIDHWSLMIDWVLMSPASLRLPQCCGERSSVFCVLQQKQALPFAFHSRHDQCLWGSTADSSCFCLGAQHTQLGSVVERSRHLLWSTPDTSFLCYLVISACMDAFLELRYRRQRLDNGVWGRKRWAILILAADWWLAGGRSTRWRDSARSGEICS